MITKKTHDIAKTDFQAGASILLNKPLGWTSFKVVHEVRKAIQVKKVGHAGTLDPLATGLLILCSGKKTKEISGFQDLPKTYISTFTIGKRTKSMDAETEPFIERPYDHITNDMIHETANSFLGEIEQIPPMFSAVNVNGKKLYKYARKGKTVEREPRKVTIHSIKVLSITLPQIVFEISCSKGTYIRVIADDFGEKIGCGAYISSLQRTKIGQYPIEDALEVSELREIMAKHRPDA